MTCPNGTSPHTWPGHNPAYHPLTKYSLSPCSACTVCAREIYRAPVEFPKTFLRERIRMQFEWIGTILTKYQPLREDSNNKFPSFLSKVCQVGHTIDRHIKPCILSCKSACEMQLKLFLKGR